jgi:hypothetical protein
MTYSWSREALKQGLTAMKHSEPSPPPFISSFSIISPTYDFLQKDKTLKGSTKDIISIHKDIY